MGVSMPILYDWGITEPVEITNKLLIDEDWSFIVIESYEGMSLRELIRKDIYSISKVNRIIKKCKDFIDELPEDVPLDISPGNIVFSEVDGNIRFVDFLPPDPWLYAEKIENIKELEEVFPSLRITLGDKNNISRYYNNYDRWKKFKYHALNYSVTRAGLVLP